MKLFLDKKLLEKTWWDWNLNHPIHRREVVLELVDHISRVFDGTLESISCGLINSRLNFNTCVGFDPSEDSLKYLFSVKNIGCPFSFGYTRKQDRNINTVLFHIVFGLANAIDGLFGLFSLLRYRLNSRMLVLNWSCWRMS